MPTYEIEQYELHTMKYKVQADTEAEAIAKLLAGESEPVEGSLEFIMVGEEFGLPVDEYPDLAEALRTLGVSVADVIPSIRGIEKVEG
jgi:hypothetical protein